MVFTMKPLVTCVLRLGSYPVEDDLGDVCRAFAAGLCAGVADRGEGAGDECHHLFGGDVVAHGARCVRAMGILWS
jgi:hypothetical protein